MSTSCPEAIKSQVPNQEERTQILDKLRQQLKVIRGILTTVFDASDIDYLITNFSSEGLRQLISHAEVKAAIGEDVEEEYWLEMARAARLALAIRLQLKANVPNQTPPSGRGTDIQGIKNRVDIVALIEQYTKLRKAGRNFTGCCPLHDDRHPSLTVYPERQSWHCFGCNKGGDIFDFVEAAENVDFRGAITFLQRFSHGT